MLTPKDKTMVHKLQFALTAVLLMALIGGGAGTAAADTTNSCDTVDNTKVVNDNDVIDTGDTLNGLNTNVLGVTNQDSPVDVL